MILHPPPALRRYAVGMIGFSAAVALAAAFACGWGLVHGGADLDGFGRAGLGFGVLAASVLAVGLGLLTGATYRGPDAPHAGRLGGGPEGVRVGSLLLTGSFLLGLACTMISQHLAGRSHVPEAVIWALAGAIGLLGLALLLGFALVASNLFLRGPTRLRLDTSPVRLGDSLRGRIEVPFAAERRLELQVDLELGRSVPGPNPDDPRDRCIVFRASITTVASEPLGPRRAAAPIEIPLDLETPPDKSEPNVTYTWHMEVAPTRKDVWWNAVLEPPIEIER